MEYSHKIPSKIPSVRLALSKFLLVNLQSARKLKKFSISSAGNVKDVSNKWDGCLNKADITGLPRKIL